MGLYSLLIASAEPLISVNTWAVIELTERANLLVRSWYMLRIRH